MKIANVLTPRSDAPSERDVRADYVQKRPKSAQEAERTEHSVAASRDRRVRERDDDNDRLEGVSRRKARAQFSAMLAALEGHVRNVPTDPLTEETPANEALLDRLLDGSLGEMAHTDPPTDPSLTEVDMAAVHAADQLQYGLRRDASTRINVSTAGDIAIDEAARANTIGSTQGGGVPRGAALARINEVLGRIVARRGTTVEELKARGENEAADARVALDALLLQAGTPAGRELAEASERAAIEASMSALTTASALSAADVTTPVRDPAALAPALQARLDRVIDRMKSEYGHDISVVETVRSQERQDFLYEQGRTRAGAVVTWTHDSAHLSGDAVDVLVDGSWTNAAGFGRLQRIAQEEGLRTLGVRDPGHLELPREARRNAINGGVTPKALTDGATQPRITHATLQPTSAQGGVARVAGVAQAASIARVADTGGSRRFEGAYGPSSNGAHPATATTVAAASIVSGQALSHDASGDAGAHDASTNDRRSSPSAPPPASGSTSPAFGTLHTSTVIAAPSDSTSTVPSAGVLAAERVSDLQQLRDNAPAGSVSRMTLTVDTPDGGTDQITIDLRGATVDTQITTDAASADRLRMRTAELQDALGRHGLESDSVRISASGRADSSDAARVVAGERDGVRLNAAQQGASGDGATNQGQRERAANAREWDKPESSRQSRDEQRESSKRGAGQPGQRDAHNRSEP